MDSIIYTGGVRDELRHLSKHLVLFLGLLTLTISVSGCAQADDSETLPFKSSLLHGLEPTSQKVGDGADGKHYLRYEFVKSIPETCSQLEAELLPQGFEKRAECLFLKDVDKGASESVIVMVSRGVQSEDSVAVMVSIPKR